jgi:hypothetical protein
VLSKYQVLSLEPIKSKLQYSTCDQSSMFYSSTASINIPSSKCSFPCHIKRPLRTASLKDNRKIVKIHKYHHRLPIYFKDPQIPSHTATLTDQSLRHGSNRRKLLYSCHIAAPASVDPKHGAKYGGKRRGFMPTRNSRKARTPIAFHLLAFSAARYRISVRTCNKPSLRTSPMSYAQNYNHTSLQHNPPLSSLRKQRPLRILHRHETQDQ